MEPWFILCLLGYTVSAFSAILDKFMMNRLYHPVTTVLFRTLFNAVFLTIAGLLILHMTVTPLLLLLSAVPALLLIVSFAVYLKVLQNRDASEIQPFSSSLDVLFIFLASIILLHEPAETINYVGIIVIVLGIYIVVTEQITKIPRLDRNLLIIAALVPLDVAYAMLIKTYLGSIEPIGLAVSIYVMSVFFLLIVAGLWHRRLNLTLTSIKSQLRIILASSFFAAIAVALLYTALSQADASKVYPISGISTVTVFLLASVLLKEKFYWHRLLGTFIVILGIYLISL
jgi:uncharacterized membrane protein